MATKLADKKLAVVDKKLAIADKKLGEKNKDTSRHGMKSSEQLIASKQKKSKEKDVQIVISKQTIGKALGQKVENEDWQQYTEEVDIAAIIAEHFVGYMEQQYDAYFK